MSKIVIDAREYSTSTGRYVSKLIEYLEKIDDKNSYIILLKNKDLSLYRPSKPNFTKVVCDYKEFTFAEQFNLAKLLYSLKADLVHFTTVQQPVLYLKKSVTTVHDLTTARFNNPSKNFYVFFIKQQIYKLVIISDAYRARQIITPSNYVKKDLINYSKIKDKKITVTYEAADPIPNNPKPYRGLEDKQYIMYVGRPMTHKNLWMLIEAFDALKALYPDLVLVLAGKQDQNYLAIKKKVVEHNYRDVVFTDFVSESELRWLYENCQAYVFPSLSEGFGLPGLEAMVNGAPVVSSSLTSLPEIYQEAAIYFDATDKQSMVEAISKVLSDNELRRSLVEAGHRQVAKYSWLKMAEQTLEVYKKVLKIS